MRASDVVEARANYERDGFCVTPPVIDESTIAAAIAGSNAVIDGEYEMGVAPYKREWSPGDDPQLLIKIGQPHQCNRAILDLVSDARIGRWAAALAGTSYVQAFAVDLIVKRGHSKPGANIGWHQDSPYLRSWIGDVFTVWIALSDVDPASGPVLYVPGSHRLGELAGTAFDETDLASGRRRISLPDGFEWREAPSCPSRGALAFHHRCTLHASGPNLTAEPRLALAVRLRTAECRPAPESTHVHAQASHLADAVAAPVLFSGPPSPSPAPASESPVRP